MNKSSTAAIHASHDQFFRKAMTDRRVARDFFTAHLPPEILQRIDLNQLELQPSSYINDVQQEAIADVLYKTFLNGKETYLYLLVEHQRKPDKLMPFRVLKYTCNIMDAHLKKMKKGKIPLVYPIVVHQGKQPWPYPIHVQKLVDAPDELVESYFLKPFHLIDLGQTTDETLKQQGWSGLMEFVQKHIFADDVLPHLKEITTLLRQVAQDGGKGFVDDLLEYMVRCGELKDGDRFIKLVNTEISTDIGDDTMTLAQHWMKQGKEEGRLEGKVEGKAEGKAEMMRHIALNLLLEGEDAAFVAKVTGLSLSEASLLKEKEEVIH